MKIKFATFLLLAGLFTQSSAMNIGIECKFHPVVESKTKLNDKFEYVKSCVPTSPTSDSVSGLGMIEHFKNTKFRAVIAETPDGTMTSWGVLIVDNKRGEHRGPDQNNYVVVNTHLEHYRAVATYWNSIVSKVDCINDDACLLRMLETEISNQSENSKLRVKQLKSLVRQHPSVGTSSRFTQIASIDDYHRFSISIEVRKGSHWEIYFERENGGNTYLSGVAQAE